MRTALVCLILVLPATAFPVPKAATAPSLVGTSWLSEDGDDQTRFTFEPNGVLKYRIIRLGPSQSKNSWSQHDAKVTFELNGHFCEFEGYRSGSTLRGRYQKKTGMNRDMTLTLEGATP